MLTYFATTNTASEMVTAVNEVLAFDGISKALTIVLGIFFGLIVLKVFWYVLTHPNK